MSTNQTSQKESLVTLPLKDLMFCLLGGDDTDGVSCTHVPMTVALVLDQHLKGSLLWKVDFEADLGDRVELPTVWRYSAWKEWDTKQQRDKDRAEKERVERWIWRKNQENLTRAIMRTQSMTEDFANRLAYSLLKKNAPKEVLEMMGLNKLVVSEEEL